jgi:hypothetical protein
MTVTTSKSAKPAKKTIAKKEAATPSPGGDTFTMSAEGYVIQHHRPDPEAMRAAVERMRERLKKDKRKGDAVKFLREFRDNPRAR